jgi:subtilase family serine protease
LRFLPPPVNIPPGDPIAARILSRNQGGHMGSAVPRRIRCALILLAVCVIGGSTAQATRADSGQPSATPSSSYSRVCNAPQPGEAACLALRRNQAPIASLPAGLSPAAAAAAVSGYGPADLVSAYNLPTSQGAGKLVAIVDAYDDPNVASDLATYRSQFGLPACTTANGCFRKINQNGGTTPPAANSGWAGEIALDVEMVSATCPLCKILLVEATSPTIANLGTAVNQAVAQGAVVVSNSYGGPESSSDPSTVSSYYNHPGVAITVSSGDDGYGVEFPASSPYVTAVGGTSLSRSSNARGWSETAWNGAGSGCSSYEAKPSFQTDSGCSRRTVADVSAIADPNTGIAMYGPVTSRRSGWMVFGGTSVAAPLIAGIYGVHGGTANFGADPYSHATSLNDVTAGSNGNCGGTYLCTGAVGYDGPSGLGTPIGTTAF